MPVLIPYTSRFSSTAWSTTACAARTASRAEGSSAIRDPGSDSRRVSAIVSRPGRSTNVWSLMSGFLETPWVYAVEPSLWREAPLGARGLSVCGR